MILGICGSGGLGREALELAQQINTIQNKWVKICFIETDKFVNELESIKKEIDITTVDNAVSNYGSENLEFIVAVGEPSLRRKIYDELISKGLKLSTLISPEVHIPKSTKVGKGAVICPCSFISCNVEIGENVYIIPHVNVGHDTKIGDNSIIAGFANIAGGCDIGKNTFIGMSACIKEYTKIGDNTIIAMGSVVVRDIPAGVLALGNPARPIMKSENKRVFG